MKDKRWLIFSLLVFCGWLALSAGCTPEQKIDEVLTEYYKKGHAAAENFIADRLEDYRIVILLEKMNVSEREQFLKGFLAAYDEAEQSQKGQRYAEILSEAVKGGTFEEAIDRGIPHAKKLTTDAQIQTLIRRSIGISRSGALAWKAGYIEGFKKGLMEDRRPANKAEQEKLYEKGEAMYEALRAASGL